MTRPSPSIRRATARLQDAIARGLLVAAPTARRRRWLTVNEARLLSRLASSNDGLSRLQLARVSSEQPTMVGPVRELVLAAEPNPYSLGTAALNFIHEWVQSGRPAAILEFGSGVSTLVLTACMTQLHCDRVPRVFSIDESEQYLHETDRMLATAGLEDCARLAHRPLRQRSTFGRLAPCYDLDEHFLRVFIAHTPEFVLVDGPSGGGLARLGTLPLALPHLAKSCTVLLDDALRDDELEVASLWAEMPSVTLGRIHLVGHGILEGHVLH